MVNGLWTMGSGQWAAGKKARHGRHGSRSAWIGHRVGTNFGTVARARRAIAAAGIPHRFRSSCDARGWS